jgi:S-adenosylmethionine synthetase
VKGGDLYKLAIQVKSIQPITIKRVAGSSLYKPTRKSIKYSKKEREKSKKLRKNSEAIKRETLRARTHTHTLIIGKERKIVREAINRCFV